MHHVSLNFYIKSVTQNKQTALYQLLRETTVSSSTECSTLVARLLLTLSRLVQDRSGTTGLTVWAADESHETRSKQLQ